MIRSTHSRANLIFYRQNEDLYIHHKLMSSTAYCIRNPDFLLKMSNWIQSRRETLPYSSGKRTTFHQHLVVVAFPSGFHGDTASAIGRNSQFQ